MSNVTIFFSGYNSITQGYNEGGYESDVAFTALTSALGTATALAGVFVSVSGVAAVTSEGSVTIVNGSGATIALTGIAATSGLGSVNIWSSINPDQTPDWTNETPSQSPNWTEIAA
jgi:hypothetical protein